MKWQNCVQVFIKVSVVGLDNVVIHKYLLLSSLTTTKPGHFEQKKAKKGKKRQNQAKKAKKIAAGRCVMETLQKNVGFSYKNGQNILSTDFDGFRWISN